MKDYIVLEINSKQGVLCQIEIETPNEFLLVDNIASLVNNRIFDQFIDEIFWLTVNEFAHEVDEKIDNVYVTFLNDYEELVCSIVIDKFKPRRSTYRMRIINWQASGHIFKYAEGTENGM